MDETNGTLSTVTDEEPDAGVSPSTLSAMDFSGVDEFTNAENELYLQSARLGQQSPIDAVNPRRTQALRDYSERILQNQMNTRDDLFSKYDTAVDDRNAIYRRRDPASGALPWLKAGAAMLSPSKTGRFTESLGAGVDAYAGAKEKEIKNEAERAGLEANSAVDAAGKKIQMQQTEAKGASDTLSRLDAAEIRRAVASGQRYKVIPTVGLVDLMKLDENGHPTVVVKGNNQENIRATMIRSLIASAPKLGLRFGKPDDISAWATTMVDTVMKEANGQPGTTTTAAVPGAPAPAATPNGQPAVAPVPGAPAATPGAPAADAHVSDPRFAEFITPPAGAPGVTVVNKATEEGNVAGAKEEGKNSADRYAKEIVPSAEAARGVLTNTKIWDQLNSNTGRFAPFQQALGSILEGMGLAKESDLVKKAKNLQVLGQIVNTNVLEQQILQKGVQTEGDAKRMASTGMQTTNIPEANRFISDRLRNTNERILERQRFFDDYRTAKGSFIGADSAWNKYVQNNDLTALVDGGIVFYYDWMKAARAANKGVSDKELHNEWKKVVKESK